MEIKRTFTITKGLSGWNYQVGRFTDKLNEIADGFLKAGKTHYPTGVKVRKFDYKHIATELSRYCRAMRCKTPDERCAALDELFQLCEKSDIGFTRKYWWSLGSNPHPSKHKTK